MRIKATHVVSLLLAVLVAVSMTAVPAFAAVSLYVDSAPNKFGSSAYAPWETNAYATASAGTFVNMANSVNPSNAGTRNFEIEDAVVYSFGDLGKRLHFVYWIPGTTLADLEGNFEVALYYDWDGVTYDFYNEYYGTTWLTPSSWKEQNGGVIGTAGFAWWGAYQINTQEALDAELAEWDRYQGNIRFVTKLDGVETSITAFHSVPEPGTLLLLGSGLLGLVVAGRKKFRK